MHYVLKPVAKTVPDNYQVRGVNHYLQLPEHFSGYSITQMHWDEAERQEELDAQAGGDTLLADWERVVSEQLDPLLTQLDPALDDEEWSTEPFYGLDNEMPEVYNV